MADRCCVLLLESELWRWIGLATFLAGRDIDVIGTAGFNVELPEASPDVVLVAHKLIDECGGDLVDRVRRAYPSAMVLVHGDSESMETTATLLTRGARGYFVLSSPCDQLIEAITVVLEGGVWAPRRALVLLAEPRATPAEARESDDGEQLLLRFLRDGLSNKEIAARLGLAEVTVKARLTRLYRRHGVRTRLQLLSSAIRQKMLSAV